MQKVDSQETQRLTVWFEGKDRPDFPIENKLIAWLPDLEDDNNSEALSYSDQRKRACVARAILLHIFSLGRTDRM